MAERKFVRAEEGPDNSVIYYDSDGNRLTRYWKSFDKQSVDEASTRSWRNNNPGNHVMGIFARKNGAIGQAGHVPNKENKDLKFAVFPDFATGRRAQANRLREGNMYIDLSLNKLPRKYLGVKDGEPDTQAVIDYRKSIKFFAKLDMDRTIRSLNDEKYEKLLDAMMKHEGWREGKEEYKEIKKIVGVHVDEKHVISELLVSCSAGKEWIKKAEAIILAAEGLLDAMSRYCQKLCTDFLSAPSSQN